MTTQSIEYTMNRKKKGSRTLFFATINGKRLSKTLWARKYEAKKEVNRFLEFYGAERLKEMAGM